MAEAMQAKGRLSRETYKVHFYSIIKKRAAAAAAEAKSWSRLNRQIFRFNSYANENSFGCLTL
jgi:hypothetical protein